MVAEFFVTPVYPSPATDAFANRDSNQYKIEEPVTDVARLAQSPR